MKKYIRKWLGIEEEASKLTANLLAFDKRIRTVEELSSDLKYGNEFDDRTKLGQMGILLYTLRDHLGLRLESYFEKDPYCAPVEQPMRRAYKLVKRK